MRRLEDAVDRSEGEGLRARWQSGQFILGLRAGRKQLPNGLLGEMAKTLEVHQSELSARMKFAAKFPTEAQLSNAVGKYRTWHEIKAKALTDSPRRASDEQVGNPKLRRAVALVKSIDPATLGADDTILLKALDEGVRRLVAAVKTLSERKAA